MAKPATLLSLLILVPLATPACDRSLCVDGCGSFDMRFQSCNYDSQVYSSYEHCICAGLGTATDNENSLLNCLSCNANDIGSNPPNTYKYWAAVCAAYESEGEAEAERLDKGAEPGQIDAIYSKNIMPLLASICPAAYGGSATVQPMSSAAVSSPEPVSSQAALTTTAAGGSPGGSSGRSPSGSTTDASQMSQTDGSTGAAPIVTQAPHNLPAGLVALAIGYGLV